MNKDEIINLVEMLHAATFRKKILWSIKNINTHRAFATNVNGCDILVGTDYAPLNDCQVGMIDLYNTVGTKFLSAQYFEDEDTDIYIKIKVLCTLIEDQLFLVTESKEKIFSSLEKLLRTDN